MVRKVVHLGPCSSRGGMSVVIRNLLRNPPEGWKVSSIDTNGETIIEKISRWFYSRSELREVIRSEQIDLVHIHVTHSFSWWRKSGLMRICEKQNTPTVIHIHSGKFDSFCSGLTGISVKRRLSVKGRKTVVLENRWLDLLSGIIPKDSEVIPNSSEKICERADHSLTNKVRLLLLARESPVKGQRFAVEVVNSMDSLGRKTELIMTGNNAELIENSSGSVIRKLGWISEDEKIRLIRESDFLISPSDYEGSSMSVIEAMVCGLPCIVSAASSETVDSEKFVIESDDPDDWAKRIAHLHDDARYDSAVKETIEIARKFNPDICKKRISEIYENLVRSDDGD